MKLDLILHNRWDFTRERSSWGSGGNCQSREEHEKGLKRDDKECGVHSKCQQGWMGLSKVCGRLEGQGRGHIMEASWGQPYSKRLLCLC